MNSSLVFLGLFLVVAVALAVQAAPADTENHQEHHEHHEHGKDCQQAPVVKQEGQQVGGARSKRMDEASELAELQAEKKKMNNQAETVKQLAMLDNEHKKRQRRQITDLINNMAQQGGSSGVAGGSNNPLSQLGSLNDQVDRLQAPIKMFTSLFSSSSSSNNQKPAYPPATFDQTLPAAINNAAANQQQGQFPAAGQIMSTFTELVRSSRDNGANMAGQAQQGAQQMAQQSATAAQNAQGGIASALSEISQGLQRIASNNPNLLPDVKSLYSSVSSKLTSASQSAGQAAQPVAQPLPIPENPSNAAFSG